jgi:hypothetical protein
MAQECFQKKCSTNAAIPFSPTSVFQIETTQKLAELGTVKLDAPLTVSRHWQLENANLEPLVPNAKTVDVPEQNLEPVPLPTEEQKQVARAWILVKRLLRQAHQAIEAEVHLDRRRADKDSQLGEIRHACGFLLVCRPVTA